jgi:hypothetical protein
MSSNLFGVLIINSVLSLGTEKSIFVELSFVFVIALFADRDKAVAKPKDDNIGYLFIQDSFINFQFNI